MSKGVRGFPSGPAHPRWKGGAHVHRDDGRDVVERVLGHKLSDGAIVHHVNERRSDNRNCNLAALQSVGEHMRLHRRKRVREAGGNPWRDRLCRDCGPQPEENFRTDDDGSGVPHFQTRCRPCSVAYEKQRTERRRNARISL